MGIKNFILWLIATLLLTGGSIIAMFIGYEFFKVNEGEESQPVLVCKFPEGEFLYKVRSYKIDSVYVEDRWGRLFIYKYCIPHEELK